MRGVYTLTIRLRRPCRVRIGRHVSSTLKKGLYLYTGSAMGRGSTSLEARIRRHLRRDKKQFWHIDRILASKSARVLSIVFANSTSKAECRINAALLKHPNLRVFLRVIGSSDCRCGSHFLMATGSLRSLQQEVRSCYVRMGFGPHVLKSPNLTSKTPFHNLIRRETLRESGFECFRQ